MKNFVKFIVQALVDNPEQVIVDEIKGNQSSVIELRVAREDTGKVIGKKGQMANALRTIIYAASAKERKRTLLEIVE